uniref:Copine domain-containing protein n=1 Tax=Onchocerca volvulus TaxID=6282 RepID=A0A8R1Y1G7_ONCVO
MNMTRIRQIIALRKALKAGPLLPPISKRLSEKHSSNRLIGIHPSELKFLESFDVQHYSREKHSGDGLCSNKMTARDFLEIDLRISELKTDLFAFNDIVCLISVHENSSESPWKLVTTTEIIPKKTDTFSIPNAFSVEYTFKRDQYLKIEICDYNEDEVTVIGATTFFVTEIITTSPNLSKPLIQNNGDKYIAVLTISYTAQPKVQTIVLQFCGKNFRRKGLENTQIYFQIFRMGENEVRNLLYTSDYQLYSSRILWKPFKLSKNVVVDSRNRNFEVLCYSRDDHRRCSIIGQFTTTSDVLFESAKERKTLCLEVGLENNKKTNGIIEVVKCNEITMYSFLDYITNGYCLSLAIAVDFSISNSNDISATFANDVECIIRSICEPFRRHNLQVLHKTIRFSPMNANLSIVRISYFSSQSYAAFGFGARIPPYFRKSQQFCLNLERDPNCQGIDGLINAFWKANAQVQPSTNAHFAHIIYHLSKLASNAFKRKNQSQCPYFVLAIISKGKINDIRETVQATIFASKTPLSIIFIATENDCAEMERLGLSAGRISYQNRRAERDMLQFVALTKFRNKLPEDANFWELLTERALRRIPWQMIDWLMKNEHVPHDFKRYACWPKQGSSRISGRDLENQQETINEAGSSSDQSSDDLDEAEHASTSDYCNVKEHTETEDFSAISSMPSFTSKNA